MTLNAAIDTLMRVQKKQIVWTCITDLIVHDASTVAPIGSVGSRREMLSAVSDASYRAIVSDEAAEALEILHAHTDELTPEQKRMCTRLERTVRATRSVPLEVYVEHERIVNDADATWHRAKQCGDYAMFEPHLDRLVESCKIKAAYIAPEMNPYDYWLDSFQEGNNQAACDRLFSLLEAELPPVIRDVRADPQERSLPEGPYPLEQQRMLSERLMQILRVDSERCILGETEHPFTSFMTRDDVRMTTHYYKADFTQSMFSVLHEGGHALYELHMPERYSYTSLGVLRHAAIHESQSRLFENNVGRSHAFLTGLLPELTALFPQLAGLSGEALYHRLNRCVPSPVRMNSDELSYPMHIIIRYRIEQALFRGEIRAKDVPAIWNEMYKTMLGVNVPSEAQGALQDSHWATGLFGYFPSYALGSAYAAQMMERMEQNVDLDTCLSRLDLAPVQDWLNEHLWRFAATLPPDGLLRSAFGGEFDPGCYVRYLKEKFAGDPTHGT